MRDNLAGPNKMAACRVAYDVNSLRVDPIFGRMADQPGHRFPVLFDNLVHRSLGGERVVNRYKIDSGLCKRGRQIVEIGLVLVSPVATMDKTDHRGRVFPWTCREKVEGLFLIWAISDV